MLGQVLENSWGQVGMNMTEGTGNWPAYQRHLIGRWLFFLPALALPSLLAMLIGLVFYLVGSLFDIGVEL